MRERKGNSGGAAPSENTFYNVSYPESINNDSYSNENESDREPLVFGGGLYDDDLSAPATEQSIVDDLPIDRPSRRRSGSRGGNGSNIFDSISDIFTGRTRVVAALIIIVCVVLGLIYLKNNTTFFTDMSNLIGNVVSRIASIFVIAGIIWIIMVTFMGSIISGINRITLYAILFVIILLFEFIPALGSLAATILGVYFIFRTLIR